MATLLQLRSEPVWNRQVTPPSMLVYLVEPLRAHYGLPAGAVAAAGDQNHLKGRHRSRDWDLTSAWCTNRAYATTDARDKAGDGSWYRACDVGLTGQRLFDACRRLDAAVRAGKLPELAEWFGTYDGRTVVGWYEGHASTSDSSHLSHLHLGVWTQYANDPAVMQRLYDTITGTTEDDMILLEISDKAHGWSWTVLYGGPLNWTFAYDAGSQAEFRALSLQKRDISYEMARDWYRITMPKSGGTGGSASDLLNALRAPAPAPATVDPAVIAAAVKAALADPDVIAGLVKADNDDEARRMQG